MLPTTRQARAELKKRGTITYYNKGFLDCLEWINKWIATDFEKESKRIKKEMKRIERKAIKRAELYDKSDYIQLPPDDERSQY